MAEHELSQKIRDLRAMHNLTLEQVAKRVGVGKSTIRKWETGMIENMRRDKIAKLADALYTTPAYLMGWEEATSCRQSGYWDGTRLSEVRNAQGYSVEQIATLLKISVGEYLQLESGSTEPTFVLLLRLADVLSCDLDYLCHKTARINGGTSMTQSAEAKLLLHKYYQLSQQGKDFIATAFDYALKTFSEEEDVTPVAKNA